MARPSVYITHGDHPPFTYPPPPVYAVLSAQRKGHYDRIMIRPLEAGVHHGGVFYRHILRYQKAIRC